MRRTLVFASFLAGLATALFYRYDSKRIEARLNATGRVVKTPYGPVDFAELGSGDPVLVLHGTGGGFDQALDMTAALADRDFRLIAPSRFGYLRTAAPDEHSTADAADAAAALLDTLGIERCAVIGISAGAWPALQFTARHPKRCRAAVLLVPATDLPRKTRLLGKVLTKVFACDFLSWAMVRLSGLCPALRGLMVGTPGEVIAKASAREKRRVRSIVFDSLPAHARRNGIAIDLKQMSPHDGCDLRTIACPVLAISAEDDDFKTAARAREIAKAVPDGTAIIYSSGGHALVGRYISAVRETAEFLLAHK